MSTDVPDKWQMEDIVGRPRTGLQTVKQDINKEGFSYLLTFTGTADRKGLTAVRGAVISNCIFCN